MGIAGAFFFGTGTHSSGAAADLPVAQGEIKSDKDAKPGETRVAVFAGGCFWCVEGVFDQLEGVTNATSGYAGGTKETANYRAVCNGDTGHAEAVKITYDPSKITYAQLLRVFFTTHNPTTKNRQGPDSGTQYRSVVFYLNDEQKQMAETYIKQLDAAKVFRDPIVTTVEPLKIDAFYNAEGYHQNFVACNPDHGYIRQQALPKIEKVHEKFPELMKHAATQPAQPKQ